MSKGKEGREQGQADESWDDCVSDSSDVPGFLSSCQQKKMYSAEMIKNDLVRTKNQHNVIIEEYFPDLAICCASARLHMNRKEQYILDELEVYRLKIIVTKVRKQMGSDDFKNLNVCV